MAKSLIGKKKASTALVKLPAGNAELFIVDISYQPFDS
jgi:transcription elongation GreA/GreB family factor